MTRKPFYRGICLILGFFLAVSVNAQKDTITPIEKIDVDKHLDTYCVIEGLVTQYTPEKPGATAYYIIKGDYGRPIQVNTSSKRPVINRKYRVKGIIKADPLTDQPYIVENAKSIIIPVWIFVIVGVILLALVILLLVFIQKGRSKAPKPGTARDARFDDSLKTVKIVKNPDDPTLVFIPGKLKILNGEDKGRELVLAGIPTPEGGILTIGKREETGVKKFCHIQLMEKTVSREQAEIIYHKRDNKLFVKNLSKVNYTRLNGEEIYVDEAKQIKPGDKLTMGELEFEYID
jgi:hypothetical protein